MNDVNRSGEPSELARNADNVEVAVHSDDRGTPEFGRRMLVGEERVISRGAVRRVRRTIDVLARMYHNRTISPEMVEAGRRFQRLFHDARFEGHSGSSFGHVVPRGRGRRHGERGQRGNAADRALDARAELARAVGVLGGHRSPGASAVWFVLGEEAAIRDYARRSGWGAGRTMTEEVARGVLVAALGVLAAHWETGESGDLA